MRPSVGSVMRLRIFSSVLLPAPLRPMIKHLAALHLERDVLQRPELFSRAIHDRRMTDTPAERSKRVNEHVTQRRVARTCPLMIDEVSLPEPVDPDHGFRFAHVQITSAKVRSVRRK